MKKGVGNHTTIEGEKVFVNGNDVLAKLNNCKPYENIAFDTDMYTVVGIHGCNPHVYENLDRILLVEEKTGKYAIVPVYQILGKDYTGALIDITKDGDDFIFYGVHTQGRIYVTVQNPLWG